MNSGSLWHGTGLPLETGRGERRKKGEMREKRERESEIERKRDEKERVVKGLIKACLIALTQMRFISSLTRS